MADDRTKTGAADRSRLSADQAHEVGGLAEKFGVSREVARQTILQFGPMRAAVEAALEEVKKR